MHASSPGEDSPESRLSVSEKVARERLTTPVLFVIFNRPETTREVFEAIRQARPPRLYVAGDGPRHDRPGEEERVAEVRRYVVENVDWDCDVKTRFGSENLGCKDGVSKAISWFFENEDAGIILEDDCLPDQTFFVYCQRLLDRYRNDDRVMHVAGSCQMRNLDERESYFFSKYPQVWGWATWKDAWSKFSLETSSFDAEFREVSGQFSLDEEKSYWEKMLRRYFAGRIDTWDYPWQFSIWRHRGLAIYPTRNLVRNIGFGADSTHTDRWKDDRGFGDAEFQSIKEIIHPETVQVNVEMDNRVFMETYRKRAPVVRIFHIVRRLASRALSGSNSK